jgi:hypothetical protein
VKIGVENAIVALTAFAERWTHGRNRSNQPRAKRPAATRALYTKTNRRTCADHILGPDDKAQTGLPRV